MCGAGLTLSSLLFVAAADKQWPPTARYYQAVAFFTVRHGRRSTRTVTVAREECGVDCYVEDGSDLRTRLPLTRWFQELSDDERERELLVDSEADEMWWTTQMIEHEHGGLPDGVVQVSSVADGGSARSCVCPGWAGGGRREPEGWWSPGTDADPFALAPVPGAGGGEGGRSRPGAQ